MTAQQLWDEFSVPRGLDGAEHSAWAFGGAPDELAGLVCRGIKAATSSAFELYALENEPLPKVGDFSVILGSRDEAWCIIRTARVYTVPFCEVPARHAFLEGEGDRSLEYWRRVHRKFFSECLAAHGIAFTEDTPVCCEEFSLEYERLTIKSQA